MTKELLDSNRINYLIWRYLIESDYRETAVRLQKEWNLEDPQQLPFAKHVTNHALVSLLNKGLLYDTSEREFSRKSRDVSGPVSGFFGPLTLQPRQTPTPASAVDEEEFENARKRQIIEDEQDQIQNAPSKRPRHSNGYENGFASTPKSPMDVDDEPHGDGNGNAYPSPEQLPSPTVQTNGPEKGTQVDKVSELTAETTFLELSDDALSKNTILLQCEFNPRDPTILAAAGTDALSRIWTFSRTASTATDVDLHMQPPHHNLFADGLPPNTTATGLSWASDGLSIAISSEAMDGETAKVEVWNVDGTSIASFDAFESPIIQLRWNFSNTLLLALSPEAQGTLITVMAPTSRDVLQLSLPGHILMDQSLDATWISDDEFVLGGGDMLRAFHCVDGSISPVRKYETREGHALSKVTFDVHSRLLATASDTGMIDIWDQLGQSHSFTAHQGVITSLIWQPTQSTSVFSDESERLLASAGEDGAISIWNARSSETKSRSSMTMGSGVVALAFTPDGAFVAGATGQQILIWKVDDVNVPRASWIRGPEAGWQTPSSHDSANEEDQHSLCWDADGHRLAYGVNGLLAIISFRS